ncbi:ATP-binding protein [Lachnospiraceae bacterium ZAX-1]
MKHSLTKKITFIMISLLVGTVLLCWFINTTLLEKYYITNKQNTLLDAYNHIYAINEKEQQDDERKFTEESLIALEKISSNKNIMMMIITANGNIVYSSVNDVEMLRQQFLDIIFSPEKDQTQVIERTERYWMEQKRDTRLNSDYLILWGYLSNGNFILMRSPLESIKESVWISNRFLAYVGVTAAIVGAIIVYLVVKRLFRPILQLVTISKRMANLDFEAKFESRRKDEIAVLGQYMNQLSLTLQTTISELKSANNELKIDIEKKNEIDDMRKEFLSNVSHEFKTPLALIQGYAEGLKECIHDDEQSREFYCEVIMEESDKMNQMVKKLLTLNQLEFGNESIVMERFDVIELINGVINSTAILREQSQIQLIFDEVLPIYVWGDEFKTEEVLINYMSNAIHHVSGEKKIILSIEKKPHVVRISVFNTGTAIPFEDLDNIWIKFYKVDKARTREYGGSGIGLSIVKAIMDSFHQECGVLNREGGVEFWFELDSPNRELPEN